MGLLLCTRAAEHPFYYEKLDRNLWSIQELCYILYRYPVVIPEGFVDRKLCAWLREELGFGMLASKLEQFSAIGEEQDRLILRILREGNYYTEKEIQSFGQELRRLKEIDRAQFTELLGDTFFQIKKYGRAVESYRESAAGRRSPQITLKLADAYVTIMQFRKAAELYESLYLETRQPEPLRKLYFLHKLEPSLNRISGYLEELDTALPAEWETQYNTALKAAENSEPVEAVNRIYESGPEEFRRAAREQIRKWKKEYREKA